MPVVAMPVPSGLVRTSRSPGSRPRVGQHFFRVNHTRYSEAVDRLGIADGVSADDGAADFARFLEAAAKDGGDGFLGNKIGRHAHDVERGERAAAHGEDVGEGVGRGDLAVGERVVHDRGEEVGRLHKGAVAIETENPGVIGGGGTDENVAILILRELTQNLPQGLLAQLGSSAGAGRERSQGANLFARHADHLLSLGGKGERRRG